VQLVPVNATTDFAGGAPKNCPAQAREEEPARAYTDQALPLALAPGTKLNKRSDSGEGEGKERGEGEATITASRLAVAWHNDCAKAERLAVAWKTSQDAQSSYLHPPKPKDPREGEGQYRDI
jgi:hypothetical protein